MDKIKYITVNIEKVSEILYYDNDKNTHVLRSGERHIIDNISPSIQSLIDKNLIFLKTI